MQVGRRTEREDKTAWSLISLAVRLAKGMSLHEPKTTTRRRETFFDQQMRKRLWLTICVMDIQASFAHETEPLISVDEVVKQLEGARHLDDSDFDPGTAEDCAEKEELTCATFAFVTYHAQVSGRLLHYALGREDGDTDDRFSSAVSSLLNLPSGQGSREQIAAAFEHKAFVLLRFCDPEVSNRAWFTWHSTQCLVAAMRLAASRPLRSKKAGQSQTVPTTPTREPRGTGEMQLALRVLQKAQLVHTDARGEGMRWYVKIPWHALAMVVTGCHTCGDQDRIRQAWAVVESVWQLEQNQAARLGRDPVMESLGRLITQTRARLGPVLGTANKPSPLARPASAIPGVRSTALPSPLLTPTRVQQTALPNPLSATAVSASVGGASVSDIPGPSNQTWWQSQQPWIPPISAKSGGSAAMDPVLHLQTQEMLHPTLQTWYDPMFCDNDELNTPDLASMDGILHGFSMPM